MIQKLIEITLFMLHCTLLLKANFLTYLSSTLTIPRRQNKTFKFLKTSAEFFSTLHQFRGFAVHSDSAELTQSWEQFVLLTNQRFTCHFSGLKLILLSVKSIKKLTTTALYLKDHNRGQVRYKIFFFSQELIGIGWFLLNCLYPQNPR